MLQHLRYEDIWKRYDRDNRLFPLFSVIRKVIWPFFLALLLVVATCPMKVISAGILVVILALYSYLCQRRESGMWLYRVSRSAGDSSYFIVTGGRYFAELSTQQFKVALNHPVMSQYIVDVPEAEWEQIRDG